MDVSTLIIGAVVGAAVGGMFVWLLGRIKKSDDWRSGSRTRLPYKRRGGGE